MLNIKLKYIYENESNMPLIKTNGIKDTKEKKKFENMLVNHTNL